jgi:hypothetical protein
MSKRTGLPAVPASPGQSLDYREMLDPSRRPLPPEPAGGRIPTLPATGRQDQEKANDGGPGTLEPDARFRDEKDELKT